MAPATMSKARAARYAMAVRTAAAADEPDSEKIVADVYLYAAIGGWYGVTAAQFAADIAALGEVDEIHLYINSPGGEVYDGIAILNVIRRLKAYVRVQVDGLAASAASFIAMGGDELVMARNAELMIHEASMFAWGDAEQLAKAAASLEKTSQNVASIYAEKAGGDVEEWRTAMRTETWYSAQEAVDAGLADSIATDDDSGSDAATVVAPEQGDGENGEWDALRSQFTYAGRAAAPAPTMPGRAAADARTLGSPRGRLSLDAGSPLQRLFSTATAVVPKPPAPPAAVVPREKGAGAMPDIKKALRDRLGIPATAQLDDDGLIAAVDEALAERADEHQDPPTAAAATVPAGTVLVDQAALTQLQEDATAGRAARDKQVADDRAAAVDAAVRTGRIPPARKAAWLTLLETEAGSLEVLNTLPENTIPVEARGITGGVDESTDDAVAYDRIYPKTKEA